MKYTIQGFNQAELIRLNLDLTDAAILNWLKDFIASGKMKTVLIEDMPYYWVLYKNVLRQLPIINIKNTRHLSPRFTKYVNKGLLNRQIVFNLSGKNGTYVVYSPTPLLYNLSYSQEFEYTPSATADAPPSATADAPPSATADTKDSPIRDSPGMDTARAPRSRKGQERKAHIENVVNKIFGGKHE